MADQPDVILYTDGACSGNPGPGGWAAILTHPATGAQKTISGGDSKTTNNRMELTAVLEGLKAVKKDCAKRVHLVSDSKYVINGLERWVRRWAKSGWKRGKQPVKNEDLWRELHSESERFDLTFEHVYGHTGHPENEECDRIAVEEAEKAAGESIGIDIRDTATAVEAFDVALYVQGSCLGGFGRGAWAVLLKNGQTGEEIQLSGADPDTTSNRMELTGIIEGLKLISKRDPVRIVVLSNNAYIVNGSMSWSDGWVRKKWKNVKNSELWQELLRVSEPLDVTFLLVDDDEGHQELSDCATRARRILKDKT